MKRIIFALTVGVVWAVGAHGQGEQDKWTFGDAGIDFSGATPIYYPNNLFPAQEGSAAVCDAGGQMLFYSNGYWVWNRDHELMPELTGGVPGYTSVVSPNVGYPPLMPWTGGTATQPAVIAPRPNHPGKYYLFSLSVAGQLFYTLIDMNLNGGKGGIVSGKKGVLLAVGLAEKLTVVKGCDNIWVVARAKQANEYRAFEINDTGVVSTPVVSQLGNLPLSWYRCGVIKFSPDGKRMAAACNDAWSGRGGLELYDFDALTGILSNVVVLDSSSNLGYYYGACFSPDNTKLYATTSSHGYQNQPVDGKVRQFDVSLPTTAAILASNTIVFTNPYTENDVLGDLKRSRDGRIYFSDGFQWMHSINSPNTAGVGCNVQTNVLQFPEGSAGRGLPNDIVVQEPRDTVVVSKNVVVCFRDSVELVADTGKLYYWDNGIRARRRIVVYSGTYTVSYINANCMQQTDSIKVKFVRLPVAGPNGYSCPGANQGELWVHNSPGDTTSMQYNWKDDAGTVVRAIRSNIGDTIRGLDTGRYYLQVTTSNGCDTTIELRIQTLPVPAASFAADEIVCKGDSVQFINTSTAPVWRWHFGGLVYSSVRDPVYTFYKGGYFDVGLMVTNIEGCSDTVYKSIEVKDPELTLSADRDLVKKGEVVWLQSTGSEPYTVTGWEPAVFFMNQEAYGQQVVMDTTRTFTVKGVTEDGCVASASVEVAVHPIVFMPSGFSPNGDGRNDRFRPVSSGYIFVRFFEIYNRFGELVYSASGSAALQGWDGTFRGELQDVSTYYYRINVETKEGKTVEMKGDVVLVK